jgi:tyrosine-specific transport protein
MGVAVNTLRIRRFFDSTFLIAGMSIGASVLGLPVALRASGYVPALCGIFLVYACTLGSGILLSRLFVENHDMDLPTLFHRHLGKIGAMLFNVSYFTLAFCLLVAYWSCLNGIFRSVTVAVIVLGVLVYYCLRHKFEFLEKLNSSLMVVLIASFMFFVFYGFRGEKSSIFPPTDWSKLPMCLPTILCSFGYHQVVPLVCRRLDYNVKSISAALYVGTFIPLVVNVAVLTVGFRMFTANELSEAANLGIPVFSLLGGIGRSVFSRSCQMLSLMAIATSALGISMAMKGALRDVFKSKKILRRLTELFIVLPILPAILRPGLFFKILGLSGGIFGNFIAGILPVMPFLAPKRFRIEYALMWLTFAGIFAIECANFLRPP